ncbi:endo-1,4-beta-xylanase [Balneolaceae bacterium YR4-1]|uniref:endo-1,4-beta-xylanase n=1 Tax=Halalkalibaculum roseum TaxID=2709311 RepID=A0A6M1T087_9BACT|nr:endo-1,4-beta-xylanase [Halalkalibaculum roseum]NGP78098.1 endo-1,4-beta-xylanase [Halalkalibaculum roseum]
MDINKLLLFCLVTVFMGCATQKEIANNEDEEGLRDIVEKRYSQDNFIFGMAAHERRIGTQSEEILNKEFGYVTPSNDFKLTVIHPKPGEWDWSRPDHWVTNAKENSQIIRMHSPISPQVSDWVKEDHRTAEELGPLMEEYVTALSQRYNKYDHIKWMDVVNETIDFDGGWFGPKPGTDKWENPWPQLGYDNSHELKPPIYIKKAFKLSNKHAPNIKQIINQHGAFEEVVWDKMKQLVQYLWDNDIRLDGIGWQAHINMGWEKENGNMQRLSEFIDWCHEHGLAFHITEFNVWLREGHEGDYEAQAETFGAIVELLLEKRKNGMIGINFWNLRPKETARPQLDGTLWTDNFEKKPAYYRIRQELLDH